MKTIIPYFVCFFLVSCSENKNPVEPENYFYYGCSPSGIYIDFVDTCSYGFVVPFLQQFDSVQISYTQLGSDFVIYADSGSYKSWSDYFKNDQTIQYLFNHLTNSDSLIMQFVLSGEKSIEEERQRFESIEHFEILSIKEHDKYVSLDVPEKSYAAWAEFFNTFDFIETSQVVMICLD
ncbi:MAG: hypothetical protein IPM56_08220 [Ignavibacteriales bacterium]|nr:MAG: hypothetical protein IPM56_08220 [Ignavibacteriales bacterium]